MLPKSYIYQRETINHGQGRWNPRHPSHYRRSNLPCTFSGVQVRGILDAVGLANKNTKQSKKRTCKGENKTRGKITTPPVLQRITRGQPK